MKRLLLLASASLLSLSGAQAASLDLSDIPDFPEIKLAAPTVSDSGPTSCSQEANKIWDRFQAPELTREIKPFDEVYSADKPKDEGEIESATRATSKDLHPALPDFLREAS